MVLDDQEVLNQTTIYYNFFNREIIMAYLDRLRRTIFVSSLEYLEAREKLSSQPQMGSDDRLTTSAMCSLVGFPGSVSQKMELQFHPDSAHFGSKYFYWYKNSTAKKILKKIYLKKKKKLGESQLKSPEEHWANMWDTLCLPCFRGNSKHSTLRGFGALTICHDEGKFHCHYRKNDSFGLDWLVGKRLILYKFIFLPVEVLEGTEYSSFVWSCLFSK